MKKSIILTILTLILISGCGKASSNTTLDTNDIADDVIEISEKMFIAQLDDIYLNQSEYLNKTIRYEGIFEAYELGDTNSNQYHVFRRAPGCCGDDGQAGFTILWDGQPPANNDWVEVTGTLQLHDDGNYEYLVIEAATLSTLPTRGQEFVTR